MKLHVISLNQTEVTLKNGTAILFSYETPVAAFVPGTGYIRTIHQYSKTTSKHIDSWCPGTAKYVNQEVIDNLID